MPELKSIELLSEIREANKRTVDSLNFYIRKYRSEGKYIQAQYLTRAIDYIVKSDSYVYMVEKRS